MRSSRAAVLGVGGLVTGLLVAAVSLAPAQALPNTTLTGFFELPLGAKVVAADTSPGRSTTAVAWEFDNATSGFQEVWVVFLTDAGWGSPVLVSDPTADAGEVTMDVDATGVGGLSFFEDRDAVGADRVVVRRVGAGGAGARTELAVDPLGSAVIAIDGAQTLLAWADYDGADQAVFAAIGNGTDFGAVQQVSAEPGTNSVTSVTARSGLHIGMTNRGSGESYTSSTWATRVGQEWQAFVLDDGYVLNASSTFTYVETDPATGNALLVYAFGSAGDKSAIANVFDANPQLVLPPDGDVSDRLRGPTDLGGLGNLFPYGATVDGAGLVALLPKGKVRLGVSDGGVSQSVEPPHAACVSETRWVLASDMSFVCVASNAGDTRVDLTDGAGSPIGSIAISAGATQVTAAQVNRPSPVLLVREFRTGTDPQWLLDVGAGAGTDPSPTPSPTSPTTSASPTPSTAPTTSPSVTTSPVPPAPLPTTFTQVAKPRIKGKLLVGSTLRAVPGAWTPAPTTTSYKWLANGKAIKKATKSKLKLTAVLRGKKISVKISLKKTGITTRVVTVKAVGKVR